MNQLETLFSQAYEDFERKEFNAAIDKLNNAGKLVASDDAENSASVLNFKGFNYLGMNDLESARECFEQSININPSSSQACAGLGEIFYLCEYDIEAKAMYEWALDYNPSNQFAQKGLAKANMNLGLPENHNTLNLDTSVSKKDSFYSLVGEAYKAFSQKEYKTSLEKIIQAELFFSRNAPNHEAARKVSTLENFKGFNYLALQDIDNAKDAFENALQMNSTSSQACAGLGEVFFLQGKEEESKAMFEWAVKNNNVNAFAVSGLAKVNTHLGYPEDHNSLI